MGRRCQHVTRILVEASVLAFVVVDVASERADEVIVMANVADNVTVGRTVMWEDATLGDDDISAEIERIGLSAVAERLSDATPWRLLCQ